MAPASRVASGRSRVAPGTGGVRMIFRHRTRGTRPDRFECRAWSESGRGVRVRRVVVVLFGLVVLALAGCTGTSGAASGSASGPAPSGSGSSGPDTSGQPPTPSVPAPSGAPSGGSSTGTDAVEFSRQGGFAGLSDQLVVHADGTFTLVRLKPPVTRSGRIDAADLAQLRQVMAESGFAGLPQVQASGGGADRYTYRITYRGHTVVAQDGSVAPALGPVLAVLTGMVDKYGG